MELCVAERRSRVELLRVGVEFHYSGVAAMHKILTSEVDVKFGVDVSFLFAQLLSIIEC